MKKQLMKLAALSMAALWMQMVTAQEWCGTMSNLYRKMQQDPALQMRYQNFLDTLKEQYVTASSRATQSTQSADDIIYIPVVFHIIHNGDAVGVAENISDAQIQSQIDALNEYYNAADPNIANVPVPFQNLVADCHIKFCLAKFDPQGNPTTGIDRHQFTNATWDTEDDIDNTLKPATIWDHTRYLNIWSVRMGGDLASQGVLAYATLPFTSTASDDGVVARFNTIGTIGGIVGYQQGKTVTHEVGHWLGLLHTWGLNANCGDQGDYIADTPDQADANYGCPTFPHVSCSDGGPNGDMFMNYMDYTYDDCRSMFTLDQKDRMYFFLNGSRSSIKTAANSTCFYNLDADVASISFPTDTICSLHFKPIVTIRNQGVVTLTSGKFYFQIDAGTVQMMNWSGSIPSQEELQITLPEQQVTAGNHSLYVTFGQANGQPADNYSANDSRSDTFVAYNGAIAGAATPFSEGFEGGTFPPTNWQIINPNQDVTWIQNPLLGSYAQSTACISIDNFSYATNPTGKKDAFVTDAYDLNALPYPTLKFDVAYARYNASRSDSLNVYYSLDCGHTWVKVWDEKGSDLATAPDQTSLFSPSASQWKTVSVSLYPFSGQQEISFKFENVSGWGNALYLDNINIVSDQSLNTPSITAENIHVYPNPASDLLAVRLPQNHTFRYIQILNNMGEQVFSAPLHDYVVLLSVKNFPSGLYFVKLTGDHAAVAKKILVTH